MECYLFDGRVTAGGEPWNVVCLFVWRVTARGAMGCNLFAGRLIAEGSHGMLFVCWEGDC